MVGSLAPERGGAAMIGDSKVRQVHGKLNKVGLANETPHLLACRMLVFLTPPRTAWYLHSNFENRFVCQYPCTYIFCFLQFTNHQTKNGKRRGCSGGILHLSSHLQSVRSKVHFSRFSL
jgi:hypothetical protein